MNMYQIGFLLLACVLQSWPARSDNFISPIFSHVLDDVCKGKECGKGTCKASSNSTFGYACECQPGWKQGRVEKDDTLVFMPCVIPNCTINFSCSQAPSPVQENLKPPNTSIFDPCYWADCGGGTCYKSSIFTHRCDCSEGYYNLLNVTAFPCFIECALGTDCASLGITIMNQTTPSSPSLTQNGQNQAPSIRTGDHNGIWLFFTVLFHCLGHW